MALVNGKEITQEELEKLKESLKDSKDTQLVEVAPNQFKTRLFG
jgi:uncharacterized protein YcbK (DUF882 family)